MLAMLGMIRNAGSISDNKQNENHQSRVHGTHYVGRSFADVMQEINTRPIIDQDINELNLEWLFKDEKTSTSLQILQSINQIKLSNYDNRFDEFREWVKKLKRRSYNTAQENPEFDKYLDYVKGHTVQ